MAFIEFPKEIKWGVATASYQIEGAAFEDGRGASIWDTFSRTPGKIKNGDNGDIACDSYHRYEEDIQMMKELGIDIYRFSISWPRIFPTGTGEVNQAGLNYYHNLVDCLRANQIEPMCTLYHWDLPQVLQDQGGWANRETIEAFAHYAEQMFREFNGKITKWITINEPWCISFLSNFIGEHAPGNHDLQLATTISHHLLVAHGRAVTKFRSLGIKGIIGYAPNLEWFEPFSNKKEDIEACNRGMAWFIEWFMDPVFKGSYPEFLVEWFENKGVSLQIEDGDWDQINQTIDFIGINYYTGSVGRYKQGAELFDLEKIDIHYEKTDIGWNIYPQGFYKALKKLTSQYNRIPIYITENGACYNDGVLHGRVHDINRIKYLEQHLTSLKRAIDSGVNIKGYLTWSLLDNFEWAEGYDKRFGLVHIDFQTLRRTKKDSYFWYEKMIRHNGFHIGQ
ncbi:GH1 family beta-glucosidase [Alkalihalobacillus pseudalcaliphilus]|uniref:GH1 family beta-glucosidase n=1 Tax=Alkalihalobacillus pseudalcaliphilus TaxID=79884 RepID=UPI00064DA840|nr:GH1 family beta-glucosidase [Alkalihalobacillus pseudalcaliphilus]KMK74339.1 beta-glucosidase [Alkalihalobacillus pseudalcaliphilus]